MRTGNAHGRQAIVEIGVDLQRLLKMRRSLIVSIARAQGHAQIVFYVKIRWSDCERVLKQSEAVTPALNLRVRRWQESSIPRSYSCAEHGATRQLLAMSANPNTTAMNKPIDGI